jgi:hypothetical protein
MKSMNSAVIELRDLHLKTDIGTYGPTDTRPDVHILDLTLGISIDQVLIAQDEVTSNACSQRGFDVQT